MFSTLFASCMTRYAIIICQRYILGHSCHQKLRHESNSPSKCSDYIKLSDTISMGVAPSGDSHVYNSISQQPGNEHFYDKVERTSGDGEAQEGDGGEDAIYDRVPVPFPVPDHLLSEEDSMLFDPLSPSFQSSVIDNRW